MNENLNFSNENDSSEFNKEYCRNNIVFLLDVSSSMKYTGKLDLLKASMYNQQIFKRCRSNFYSYLFKQSKLLLETISTSQKDTIKSVIKNIQAKGLTAGGRGLWLFIQMLIKILYQKVKSGNYCH